MPQTQDSLDGIKIRGASAHATANAGESYKDSPQYKVEETVGGWIDGLGEMLGIREPRQVDDEPISVPFREGYQGERASAEGNASGPSFWENLDGWFTDGHWGPKPEEEPIKVPFEQFEW